MQKVTVRLKLINKKIIIIDREIAVIHREVIVDVEDDRQSCSKKLNAIGLDLVDQIGPKAQESIAVITGKRPAGRTRGKEYPSM